MSARPIRRFLELVGLLDRGNFAAACDEQLAETISTLESTPAQKGKATITITIDVTYEKGLINVRPSLKAKLPEGEAFGSTVLWAHDGALSTQHPSQTDMFVREAEPTRASL